MGRRVSAPAGTRFLSGGRLVQWIAAGLDSLAYGGLLVLLLLAPIPLASNRIVAWSVLEILVYASLACWLGSRLCRSRYAIPASARSIIILVLCWLGFVYLQTIDVGSGLLGLVSPQALRLHSDLFEIGVEARNSISIDVQHSRVQLLKYCAYAAVLILVLGTLRSRRRIKLFVYWLIAIGVAEAVFGLYVASTGFVIFPEAGSEAPRMGSFVNRNHFAGFLALIISLTLGLWTVPLHRRHPDARWGSMLPGSDRGMLHIVLISAALLAMVAAMILSNARAPALALAAGLAGMMLLARIFKGPWAKELLLGLIVLPVVLVTVLVIGYDDSLLRIAGSDFLADERYAQNRLGLGVVPDFWLAGVGAGNYEWILPAYRDGSLRFLTYDHAHNDYLELLIEQGAIGFALIGAAVALIFYKLLVGYRERRDYLMRGILFGVLLALAVMLVHALVEFVFQIPANAVFFFALAGLGLVATDFNRHPTALRGAGAGDTSTLEAGGA